MHTLNIVTAYIEQTRSAVFEAPICRAKKSPTTFTPVTPLIAVPVGRLFVNLLSVGHGLLMWNGNGGLTMALTQRNKVILWNRSL